MGLGYKWSCKLSEPRLVFTTGQRSDHCPRGRQNSDECQGLSNLVPRQVEHDPEQLPRNPERGVSVGRSYRHPVGQVSHFNRFIFFGSKVMAPTRSPGILPWPRALHSGHLLTLLTINSTLLDVYMIFLLYLKSRHKRDRAWNDHRINTFFN